MLCPQTPTCSFVFLTCQPQSLQEPPWTCKLRQLFLWLEFSFSWLSSSNKITKWLPNSSSVPQILPYNGGCFENTHYEVIFLLDEFVSALCVQEGGPTLLPKDQRSDCLQVGRMLLARGRESPAPASVSHPCQVTVGRLPRDFPHSRFRGSDVLFHSDQPEKREKINKGAIGVA